MPSTCWWTSRLRQKCGKGRSVIPILFAAVVFLASCSISATTVDSWVPGDLIVNPEWNIPHVLRKVLREADKDAQRLLDKPATRRMARKLDYSIFQGRSSLREMMTAASLWQRWLQHPKLWLKETHPPSNTALRGLATAVCLLVSVFQETTTSLDVTHELLLGVTLTNMPQAEYAATHPPSDWIERYPLSDRMLQLLHASLHRLEGSLVGEGSHTGYRNSEYWLGGGPQRLPSLPRHVVCTRLAQLARTHAPLCTKRFGLVVDSHDSRKYEIIAGGNVTRSVRVEPGEWDGIAFGKVCERWEEGKLSAAETREASLLEHCELVLLLRHELMECLKQESQVKEDQ